LAKHHYLVALGSNMRHPRHGSPRKVIAAALAALDNGKYEVMAASPVIESAPVGPSRRRYANGVAVVCSKREPDEMLHKLHKIENTFGRRRQGQAWGSRVLDLDLVLWSGGPWACGEGDESLILPHPAFRARDFVLGPARRIAGPWRDPLSGLTINQLHARLTKPRPAPR